MCKCTVGMLENKCGVCHDWIRGAEVQIYVLAKDYYVHSECEANELNDIKTCPFVGEESRVS